MAAKVGTPTPLTGVSSFTPVSISSPVCELRLQVQWVAQQRLLRRSTRRPPPAAAPEATPTATAPKLLQPQTQVLDRRRRQQHAQTVTVTATQTVHVTHTVTSAPPGNGGFAEDMEGVGHAELSVAMQKAEHERTCLQMDDPLFTDSWHLVCVCNKVASALNPTTLNPKPYPLDSVFAC